MFLLIISLFLLNVSYVIGNTDCWLFCPSLQQQTDCNFTSETGEAVNCACEIIKDT
jgi:hypothetical protein